MPHSPDTASASPSSSPAPRPAPAPPPAQAHCNSVHAARLRGPAPPLESALSPVPAPPHLHDRATVPQLVHPRLLSSRLPLPRPPPPRRASACNSDSTKSALALSFDEALSPSRLLQQMTLAGSISVWAMLPVRSFLSTRKMVKLKESFHKMSEN